MQHRLACVIVALTISSMALVGMAPIASASSNSLAVAKAKLALIVRTDLPAGWTTSSNGGNSSNTPTQLSLAKCLGTSVSEVNYNPPTANSPEFDQNSDGLSVNDSVSVFPNVKVATEQFDLFNSTRSPACMATWMNSPSMRASFKKGLKAGMNIGVVTAIKVASPPVAAKTIAIKINIPVQDKKPEDYCLDGFRHHHVEVHAGRGAVSVHLQRGAVSKGVGGALGGRYRETARLISPTFQTHGSLLAPTG